MMEGCRCQLLSIKVNCVQRGKPTALFLLSAAWCGNNLKIRSFFLWGLAWPTDGQLGLTSSKAVWQTQVGFIQDKPCIGAHLWVLLNLFLFLTWADVNLKGKCSIEVGSGSILSLTCPYRISLLLKDTLSFFSFKPPETFSMFGPISGVFWCLSPSFCHCILFAGGKNLYFYCASLVIPFSHAPLALALPCLHLCWLQHPLRCLQVGLA